MDQKNLAPRKVKLNRSGRVAGGKTGKLIKIFARCGTVKGE